MGSKIINTGVKVYQGRAYKTLIIRTETPRGTLVGRHTEVRPVMQAGGTRWISHNPVAAMRDYRAER